MRAFPFVPVFTLAAFVLADGCCYAAEPAIDPSTTVRFGNVQLYRGMPKTDVLALLKAGHYRVEVRPTTSERVFDIYAPGSPARQSIGKVTFDNGRLVQVMRGWYDRRNSTEPLASFLTAFVSLADELKLNQNEHCMITRASPTCETPTCKSEGIQLVCGKHIFLIDHTSVNDEAGKFSFDDVSLSEYFRPTEAPQPTAEAPPPDAP